ncbi:MAG: hypothetical protein K1X67_08405 [Fimbriimonadaceae bacterium]|nr:hypothetical protein [Fimbriimonadaceae bacterium]
MTAIADFVADPKHFLRNNILRCRGTMPAGVTSIRSFKFQAMHYTGTKLSDGRAIPVYELVPIVDQGERIRLRGNPAAANRDYLNAYWCPYFQDSYHAITVDSAADFMFTPNMDGCSFGVGSDTPSGARRVAHINLASQPNSRNLQNQTLRVDGLDDLIVNPNK